MKIKFDKILGVLREQDETEVIVSEGVISGHVTSCANLPDALEHTGEYYIVDVDTGTWILGTLKPAGIYKSNGSSWTYIDSVPETTSLSDGTTVITGTNIILEGGKNLNTTTDAINNKIVLATDDNISIDSIQFNTSVVEDCAQGQMSWDADSGTVKLGMIGSDVCLNLGQEQFIYAKNTSGAIITNGAPVYISGASGTNIEIAKADASSQDDCRKTIAMATEDIGINEHGYVTTFGYVRGINTNGFIEGGEIFIAVGGGYTQTKPALPNCIVKVGTCARANINNGVIFCNIDVKSTKDILTDSGDLTIRTELQKTLFLEHPCYRDEYVGGDWVPAGGGAAPDLTNYTMAGLSTRKYSFDGNNTEERLSNCFEIPHDYKTGEPIEVHIHWRPSDNTAGNVEWFFDWEYSKVNSAPEAQTSLSVVVPVSANQQYFHKVNSFIPLIGNGYLLGDIINFTLRRTPNGTNDTYGSDAILEKVALHIPIDTLGSRQRYIK